MPSSTRARLYRGTSRDLTHLARALQRGEIVAVPTETVYGLAANALDARACRKIFRAKRRPAGDPLIVHLHSRAELDRVAESNAAADKLARYFWPGPLTLVLPKKSTVPAIVSSGRSSVAVRVPSHPLFRRLLKLSGLPLAAPSANPFGYISPTTAAHVQAGLGRRITHLLDGGPCAIGLESTIVDLRNPRRPRLLRPGAITRAQLEKVLGCRVASVSATRSSSRAAQLAPGMLLRHYSPRTPLKLHSRLTARMVRARRAQSEAWLFIAKPADLPGYPISALKKEGPPSTRLRERRVFWLDAVGDLRGAARHLFGALRALDACGFRKIHAELAPGSGLADAINDRLRRAAARR